MDLSQLQIAAALDAISEDIEKAANAYQQYEMVGDDWSLHSSEWRLELAYSKLLVMCEALKLPMLRAEIAELVSDAKSNFGETIQDPDGDSHLKWAGPARRYHQTLQSIFLTESSQAVTKDLESIVRDSLYVIVDSGIYGSAPVNEADVHVRIQSILRCVFPDLLSKPSLAKPVKNFEPDTGIPSIRTIIEYKFISERSQVGVVADQILADTRGYISERWKSFLYVIYETERFKPEAEWRQLLRECGNAENVSAIVLSGSAVRGRSPKRVKKARKGTQR